jgi:MFS family permease
MGLGVLDPSRSENVPGTTFVYDDASRPAHDGELDSRLKYDTTGAVPIILVPQPSDDPNDPLNWPLWKRDVILVLLSILSVIASTLSPLLAANTVSLSLLFDVDFTKMALATGYHLLGVGVAGFLFVASAKVWGKRHLYLLGTVLIIVSSAWGGSTGTNYESLLWARIIQGVGLAPFEALVNASVGDLYFVHERGKRMALSNLALFGGAFFTPILVGKITHTIGWQWSFYFIAIFCGAMLPLIVLFVPETAFRRDDSFNTDITGEESLQHSKVPKHDVEAETPPNGRVANDQSPGSSIPTSFEKQPGTISERQRAANIPSRVSFARSLLPFNGRKTDENIFKLVIRPLPLFLHPAVLWACLIQGTLIGWTVMIGVVLAAIFLGPPLWFSEVETGYMYTGPFVGAILGFLLAGFLSDWSAKVMIRRNKGVYEPEFRVVLVVAQLVFGCAGLYGFGITANNVNRYGWFWPDFFFALEVMGMVLGAVASALYVVDAHRKSFVHCLYPCSAVLTNPGEIAVEAFTCLLIFKNVFSFGLTFGAYNWLVAAGILKVFYIIGSVQVGICLLSIPMCKLSTQFQGNTFVLTFMATDVFGKKNRAFFCRHNILRKTHLW